MTTEEILIFHETEELNAAAFIWKNGGMLNELPNGYAIWRERGTVLLKENDIIDSNLNIIGNERNTYFSCQRERI